MSIRWDARNKRWRYEFDRYIKGSRHRTSRLLPRGWSQAQADTYDRDESGRIYAIATGVEQADPLVEQAVAMYLRDKTGLKSYKATAEHLAAIMWAYAGRTMGELPEIAKDVRANRSGARDGVLSDATVRNRLACLKAACRYAWKAYGLTKHDPTERMILPKVSNERHVYKGRREMLQAARACKNWQAQIAIRVAFYTGMRLGELLRAIPDGDSLVLEDTKNGDRRAVPVHPKIRHLMRFFPLPGPKRTIQLATTKALERVGLKGVRFHDWRHSAASEMVNAGVDLYTVGKVLGHRDARSTARYSHLSSDALRAAVGKIGKRA